MYTDSNTPHEAKFVEKMKRNRGFQLWNDFANFKQHKICLWWLAIITWMKPSRNHLVDELPEALIGDQAYDSDKLCQKLHVRYGNTLIAPKHKNHKKNYWQNTLKVQKTLEVEKLFSGFSIL